MRDKTFTATEIEQAKRKTSLVEMFKLNAVKASEIVPSNQPWLWQGYIPDECCTLLAGRGGVGKSTMLAWIASCVSTGKSFALDGIEHHIPQGNVLILAAEDHKQYSIVPRLIAAGADLSNIHIVDSAVDSKTQQRERLICLDEDMHLLEQSLNTIGNIRLIIIDPITAYLGRLRENYAAEIRSFILGLTRLAVRKRCAIVLNTHTRKTGDSDHTSAIDSIMGSSAWTNTPRMIHLVTQDHEDETLFRFTTPKANVKRGAPLAYRLKPIFLQENEETIETSAIEWQANIIPITPDEAISRKLFDEKNAVQEAKEFILNSLAFGCKESSFMHAKAEQLGISSATLKRARQQLNKSGSPIIIEKSHTDRRKDIWYLGVCTN